jgi:hypothetical protein
VREEGEGEREEGAGRREEGPSRIPGLESHRVTSPDHVSRGCGAAPCRGSGSDDPGLDALRCSALQTGHLCREGFRIFCHAVRIFLMGARWLR